MEIINWLITSSADPKKTSLFVKGAILTGGAFVVQATSAACGLGLYCVGIDTAWVNDFAGAVEILTFASMLLIGSFAGIAGLLRKLKLGRWAAPLR